MSNWNLAIKSVNFLPSVQLLWDVAVLEFGAKTSLNIPNFLFSIRPLPSEGTRLGAEQWRLLKSRRMAGWLTFVAISHVATTRVRGNFAVETMEKARRNQRKRYVEMSLDRAPPPLLLFVRHSDRCRIFSLATSWVAESLYPDLQQIVHSTLQRRYCNYVFVRLIRQGTVSTDISSFFLISKEDAMLSDDKRTGIFFIQTHFQTEEWRLNLGLVNIR